jgi:hypothetical protein
MRGFECKADFSPAFLAPNVVLPLSEDAKFHHSGPQRAIHDWSDDQHAHEMR